MQSNSRPALEEKHVNAARLFSNRKEMIASMISAKQGIIAEVGVANGEFSQFILESLEPVQFVAFDTFGMHNYPSCWGIPTEVMFKGMTHIDYYKDRFSKYGDRVIAKQGLSQETVAQYPEDYFDLMYIDAGHSYSEVFSDAQLAQSKTKKNGIIVFNDYIMFDHLSGEEYGVVQAVNELIIKYDYKVIGFALHNDMFCDIAIRKVL